MGLRTPVARVRGLGASRGGLEHWRAQRLTALALVPLALWFVASMAAHADDGHAALVAWMARPGVAALHVMFIAALFYHAQLGVQVVVEDYVPSDFARITTLVCVKFFSALLAIISILAVVRVATGG